MLQINKVGHITRYCTEHASAYDQRSTIPGRVLALSKEEAEASPKLIRGTIYLCDIEIFALFDSVATHSFISNECVEKLKLLVIELPVLMNVSMPVGASVKTNHAYLKVEMRFGNRIILIDLVCLPILRIDVIGGMDWLSTNRAILDCEKKTISLLVCNATLAVFEDTTFIVNPEIPTFLSATQIKREYDGTFNEIEVVSEFLEVFANEMSGLPPEREIKFSIDLVPGIEPISKAPYHMAPLELEELKKKLKELLEKGFIRISVSPWVSLVLFVKKKDRNLRLCIDYR
ncbi:uncharacterized protein LOC129310774 [Prosopis cineraria]|uniref:uncharacterized protein LOC129310774 n=1 Tax=Prosopis cineraria TaxID=364024 RepID=UPI00240F902F|nr:uncharacterized protein LOC129310774 [Prosopis cineraria]